MNPYLNIAKKNEKKMKKILCFISQQNFFILLKFSLGINIFRNRWDSGRCVHFTERSGNNPLVGADDELVLVFTMGAYYMRDWRIRRVFTIVVYYRLYTMGVYYRVYTMGFYHCPPSPYFNQVKREQTDGQTDRRTDGRTDGNSKICI